MQVRYVLSFENTSTTIHPSSALPCIYPNYTPQSVTSSSSRLRITTGAVPARKTRCIDVLSQESSYTRHILIRINIPLDRPKASGGRPCVERDRDIGMHTVSSDFPIQNVSPKTPFESGMRRI